mgnify:CR=1 FL=1
MPVVMMTGKSEVTDVARGLALGADGYVTKPFDGDELLARLRAALRKSAAGAAQDGVLEHGLFRMDTGRHEVTIGAKPISLTPKEFAVLKALIEAGGRILTHANLLEQVWGRAHRDDVEYLRVVVRSLRLKVEADPSRPLLIRNEPGIGYRLI